MRTLLQKKLPVAKHYSYTVVDVIISTLLVFICLISFRPSFMSGLVLSDLLIVSAIISSVVSVVLSCKCIIVKDMEHSGKWNLKMDLITLFIMLFTICILLLALSPFVIKTWLELALPINEEYVLTVVGFVHLIGFLLYFVSISMKYIFHGPPNTENVYSMDVISNESNQRNSSESMNIILTGKNQGEKLDLPLNNLLCISTNGHYIDIFYLPAKSKKVKKVVFRNSIQTVLNSIENQKSLFQCHRSHLINLQHVLNLSGNSKKMEIQIANLKKKIPVSRSKMNELSKMVNGHI